MTKASKQKKDGTPRRRRFFRARQQRASIFYLLWTVLALLSMLIVVLFSVSQQVLVKHSFKEQASREIASKGAEIERLIKNGPPENFGDNNYNGYIRFLGNTYGVNVLVLDEKGNLIYPKDPNLHPDSPEYEKTYHRQAELKRLKENLDLRGEDKAVYEGDSEYVYGAKINLYGESTMYLHVGKSLALMETSLRGLTLRTVLLAVFVFLLAFAISSIISGWLVNPLTEMTKKAHLLAEGDFDVDFHGNDYGQELVELADSLNFARDELSKTDRMQKELIANVSHDFKTPLTMIKGYASMIIEISGENPEKRNKHAKIIVDEADRLASLVNDVLDLSKIRSGMTRLETEEVNMSEYLYEVLDRFAYVKDTQGYRFEVDAEEGLTTLADRTKIGQVLYNLIGNAVNYTGEDKVVYVSLRREGDTFRFAVRDTGVGIKPEEISGIWDRYYRSSEMHKRPVQGTGLGLSIVRTILERHGFRFGVDSEVGKGSTFYVIFPFTPPSNG